MLRRLKLWLGDAGEFRLGKHLFLNGCWVVLTVICRSISYSMLDIWDFDDSVKLCCALSATQECGWEAIYIL